MADFMTVLAASQKPTLGGKQGNPLASLLPEGLFSSVLSAQLGLPLDEAATLVLPAVLVDGIPVQAKPGDKKVALKAEVDTDLSAEAQVALLSSVIDKDTGKGAQAVEADPAALAVLQDLAPEARPAALAVLQGLAPEARPAALAVLQGLAPEARPAALAALQGLAPEARPAASIAPRGLALAASPAGSGTTGGQELPTAGRVPPTAGLDVVAAQAATASTTIVAPLLAAADDRPVNASPALDMTGVNVARQLGQFEQGVRAPESRLQAALEAPVRSQAFPAEFSEKVVWLAGRQSQWADLSLNPPQLGAIEVRLSLSGGEAGAQFFSPHPAVRDAIEAALPKLRELMAQAGIALGDAQVREEAFERRESGGSNQAGSDATTEETSFPGTSIAMNSRAGLGLVDLYV